MSKTNSTRKYKKRKHLILPEQKILLNLLREAMRCEDKKRPFMSKRTMARMLGVSAQTILNEIKKGTIKTKRKVNNKVKYEEEYSPLYLNMYMK